MWALPIVINRTCRDASDLRNNPSGLGGRETVASSVPNPQGAGLARYQLGRNLAYGLLEALGRAIVVGDYKTRPFPTEAELAKTHDVSRSVTREAVKMLTAKGLLGARPKQGTFVQPEGTWNLFDTDVLRSLLERPSSTSLPPPANHLPLPGGPQ